MDFTLSKEHEMARKLFHDFAENEVKPLWHRKLTRQRDSRRKPLKRWQKLVWASRFRRSMADRAVIR